MGAAYGRLTSGYLPSTHACRSSGTAIGSARRPRSAAAAPSARRRGSPARAAPGPDAGAARPAAARAASGWARWPRRPCWPPGCVGGLALHGDGGSPSTATELPAAPGAPLAPTSVGRIYDRVSAGVASVRTNEGSGTGFVINANGTLVTNDHVVGSDKQVEVRFEDKGDLLPAKVVGTDPSSDLAVLQLDSKPSTHAHRPAAGRLRPRAGRRRRDRDRLPARPGPHRDARDRLGPRPRDPGAQRLPDRQGHPDRRPDQPGQLRRPAARRARRGHRRQLADRDRRAAAAATSASASRSRPTACARSSRSCCAAARSGAPYLGVSSASVTPRSPSCSARTPGRRARARGHPRRPGGDGRPARRRPAGRGGDIIVSVDGNRVRDPQDVAGAIEGKSPGRP